MGTLHPIAAFKAALKTHLAAMPDIGARIGAAIHLAPQKGLKPPYILFGDAIGRDFGATGAEAMQLELDLLIVTAERGAADALDLVSATETALETPLPPLQGHHLVLVETRQLAVRHEPATATTRATLRLRALIEPL